MNATGVKYARRTAESYARSPGRPTDKIIDERVAEMIAILSTRPNIHRCHLHKTLVPRWKCHWRTVDRILARARSELMERLNRSRTEFRCEVLSAYEKELANEKPGVRLAALAGIRELLGLDEPRRQELSGPNGKPIAIEQREDKLAGFDFDGFGELCRKVSVDCHGNGHKESVHPSMPGEEAGSIPRINLS